MTGLRLIGFVCAAAAVLPLSSAAAQDATPAEAPAAEESLEARLAALEAEMQAMRQELDAEEAEESSLTDGWQLQLRGTWFTLQHNHRQSVFAGGDDHQHGWGIGASLVMPLWTDLGPIDLLGDLTLSYRNVAYSTTFRAPITNSSGTISYVNVEVAPKLRFNVSETIRPFVLIGFNMQVSSPPQDAITYLDLGLLLGAGLDVKVHERISVGFDYRYTFFGVADQDDEDYGGLTGYVGFNF